MSSDIINDAFVLSKDTVIAKKLLDKGASVRKSHTKYGYGAIHYAAIRGDTIMLDFLLRNGANINQLVKDKTVSPLMYATKLTRLIDKIEATRNKLNIMAYSMKRASGQIARPMPGMKFTTRFHDVINNIGSHYFLAESHDKNEENSLATVKYLIKRGADLHFKNNINENALYYAQKSANTRVVSYLKEIGIQETKEYVIVDNETVQKKQFRRWLNKNKKYSPLKKFEDEYNGKPSKPKFIFREDLADRFR